MPDIESALSSACGLKSRPFVITSTRPEPTPRHCPVGVFKGLISALLIETGAVALVYGAILTLRLVCR
jgi:hypothetical protein